MTSLAIPTYWEQFTATHPDAGDQYSAWSFGDTPELADELLALVLAGKKTATTSLYQLYRWTNEPLPKVGDYSIILDGRQQPRAVIQTTKVEVMPYDEVSAEHAAREGEGDLSLEQWREKHYDFFSAEAKAANFQFSEQDPVVCESFVCCD